VATWLFIAGSVVAAVGALYLVRQLGVLGYGPHIPGALPLQRLDSSDDQPLLRVAVAWIPAGLLAGRALRGRAVSPPVAVTGIAALTAVLLIAFGAVSDAATVSGAVSDHIAAQFIRAGTWTAVAFTTGAAALVLGRRAAPPVPSGR
jgi:hypothetical protein